MSTHPLAINLFKLVLMLFALMFIAIGIDKGLGGILTLGLQNQLPFIEVTDATIFSLQDSHMRFFGGLFIGLGLYLLRATRAIEQHQSALQMIFSLVFIGGLSRLSQMDLSLLLNADLIGSVMAELLVMPLLYVWLQKICAAQGQINQPANAANSTL